LKPSAISWRCPEDVDELIGDLKVITWLGFMARDLRLLIRSSVDDAITEFLAF
jgi:hypothetical protein